MRAFEINYQNPEFSGRYTLDEARFTGGQERIVHKEAHKHESNAHNIG